jgi:hypothetical protein
MAGSNSHARLITGLVTFLILFGLMVFGAGMGLFKLVSILWDYVR